MKAFFAVALAACVLALTSCDVQVPSDPVVDLAPIHAQFEARAPAHLVTGKGTVWHPTREQWMEIEFNVQQLADGSVDGKWHYLYHSRRPRGRIMARVICMSVVGNSAWLGGQAIQAMNEQNIGKWFGLRVVDHGEGAVEPGDEMTTSLWFGVNENMAWDFCSGMPTNHALQEITRGNIQVR
jgi:hypothetical protein